MRVNDGLLGLHECERTFQKSVEVAVGHVVRGLIKVWEMSGRWTIEVMVERGVRGQVPGLERCPGSEGVSRSGEV